MEYLCVEANKVNIKLVREFIFKILSSKKTSDVKRIYLCIEEIFMNICSYAYDKNDIGEATIGCENNKDKVLIHIIDSGIKFNPLEDTKKPNTSQIEEFENGGLGVFLTLKIMDEVSYKYEDNKNNLYMMKGVQDE